MQVARAQGFFPLPDSVEARVEELKGAFPSEEALEGALKEAGVPDLPTYRTLLAEALALEALEGHYRERLRVAPAALKALWLLSPEYRHGALYCARHILLPTLEEAKEALARLEGERPSPRWPGPFPRTRAPRRPGGTWGVSPWTPTSRPLPAPFSP